MATLGLRVVLVLVLAGCAGGQDGGDGGGSTLAQFFPEDAEEVQAAPNATELPAPAADRAEAYIRQNVSTRPTWA